IFRRAFGSVLFASGIILSLSGVSVSHELAGVLGALLQNAADQAAVLQMHSQAAPEAAFRQRPQQRRKVGELVTWCHWVPLALIDLPGVAGSISNRRACACRANSPSHTNSWPRVGSVARPRHDPRRALWLEADTLPRQPSTPYRPLRRRPTRWRT